MLLSHQTDTAGLLAVCSSQDEEQNVMINNSSSEPNIIEDDDLIETEKNRQVCIIKPNEVTANSV